MRNLGITLLLFLMSNCAGCDSFSEKEEAAVYAAYINAVYAKRQFSDTRFADKPFTMIVVSGLTSGFHHPLSYQEEMARLFPKPEEDTVKSFLTRNDSYHSKSSLTEKTIRTIGRYPLNPHLKFDLPHVLISDDEIDSVFKYGGWDDFYRRYPNSRGIVWLSRVGLNRNKTQALLYFGNQYTDSAGEGYLVLLKKLDRAWKELAKVTIWIS